MYLKTIYHYLYIVVKLLHLHYFWNQTVFPYNLTMFDRFIYKNTNSISWFCVHYEHRMYKFFIEIFNQKY